MSTDKNSPKDQVKEKSPEENEDDDFDIAVVGGVDNSSSITELFGAMQSVNTNSNLSKLNETTISDGKGGRIELDLDEDNLIRV